MKNLMIILALLMGTSVLGKTHKVDVSKSDLTWKGTKAVGEHVGKVKLKSGEIETKDGKLVDGEFAVDMTSMEVTDLEGKWAKKLIGHLKSDDFFAVDKNDENKTAEFDIEKVEAKGKNMYKVTGDLEIKGISKKATLDIKEDNGTYTGKLTFDRTKYDIKYKSGSFFENLGDKLIHDEVSVDLKIVVK